MPLVAAADVWAAGRASVAKLASVGVHTAADLRALVPQIARLLLTATCKRLVRELNGVRCSELKLEPPVRESIAVTRSFGGSFTTPPGMLQATAFHTGEFRGGSGARSAD